MEQYSTPSFVSTPEFCYNCFSINPAYSESLVGGDGSWRADGEP